jgi:hypothetical protein
MKNPFSGVPWKGPSNSAPVPLGIVPRKACLGLGLKVFGPGRMNQTSEFADSFS